MIALGERWSLRFDGLVLALVTGLAVVAAARQPEPIAPPTPAVRAQIAKLDLAREQLEREIQMCADGKPAPACPAPAVRDLDPLQRQADQLYREKHFGQAAELVRDAAHGDTELESLATLYHQLDRAWAIGMTPASRPTDVFEALVEARKLDIVLGGAFCAELQAATIANVPKAAIAYTGMHDYDNAARAVAIADIYGVRSATIKLVRAKLARARLIAD